MKKLISLVLSFVLIFSLGATVFAYPDDFEDVLDAQNFTAYYVYWIWSDFSDKIEDLKTWQYNSMLQLVDINEFMRASYSELEFLNQNLFGDYSRLEPLAVTIENALTEIVDVLANSEDEQLKEDTKENKDSIIDIFLSPSSSNSLKSNDIGEFSGFITDFKSVFNSSALVLGNPFDVFRADSEALLWFTDETALAIDPNFTGGGGGGGSTPDPEPDNPDPDNPEPDNPDPDNPDPDNPDPDNPDPDNPDPDNPDPDNPDPDNPDPDNPDPDNPDPDNPDPDNPDPDNPDPDNPDPEPEPDPVLNLLFVGTSAFEGSSLLNGVGYQNRYLYREYSSYIMRQADTNENYPYSCTGYIPCDKSTLHTVYVLNFVRDGRTDSLTKSCAYILKDTDEFKRVLLIGPDSNGVWSFSIPKGYKSFVLTTSSESASNLVITLDEYPVKTTSTFNLRRPSNPECVTNYYGARNYLWYMLTGGGK